MNTKETLSNIGAFLFSTCMLIIIITVLYLLLAGGVKAAEFIIPWLSLLSLITLGIDIIILVPLVIFPFTRTYAGIGFIISSFIIGVTGWFWGFYLTWMIWGGVVVVIGLLILGVGVVPLAMIATLLNGMWAELGVLFLAIILTFGLRFLGIALAD